MQISYKFHKVNGIKLHVLHAGEQHKKVVILLHGFPEYHQGWKNQIPFLVDLGYHVIVPDQRGYGESDKPKGVKSYILAELIEDIVQLIDNVTQDKITLIGHDWGGGVAWTLAQQHTERIHKLVILNMPHIQVMKDTLKTNSEQRKKSWYAAVFQLPLLPEIVIGLSNYKLLTMSLQKTSRKNTFSDLDLADYKNQWERNGSLTSMLNWYRAFFFNKLNFDKEITIPTLIIWGAKDSALAVEMAYDSIEKCTNGKLVVLDHLTHWLHHEDPKTVNAVIGDFVLE
ncbi:alpha/beta fold hydrolase [Anditalea andensis]|uniref:Alpha/beta hydrolase n=1 Tax=Anditalea andensis TaxID=1048983 RepID=A0A074LPA1_9BACT|nr:alpha/beta hydrolase [Anditalea andensis]KEO75742.1 alpha/beta hydrolase [Anditalea andensis]